MKRLFSFALVALAASMSPAPAADLPIDAELYQARPAVVIFRWTGFYFGVHAGGGFGRKEETSVPFPFPQGTSETTIALNPADMSVRGRLLGGQIGANYQFESWVFGAEAQASWARLNGSAVCTATATTLGLILTPLTGDCRTKVDALGTVAIRLGLAFDRLLVYGKGGAAWTDDNYQTLIVTTAIPATVLPAVLLSANENRWGWTLGFGIEYAFLDNWSAKIEYNYMDFGIRGLRFTDPTAIALLDTDVRERISVVKAGINFRLGVRPVLVR